METSEQGRFHARRQNSPAVNQEAKCFSQQQHASQAIAAIGLGREQQHSALI
ncbi:hypothetical protein KSD_50510 [Ktedonobacter sp. SOSP1-85]|uniref:hypothetical protein n=1 Tax=Ktedonobacter sp. SOSP1-85 TaxID=2778367 RepID=UPI001914DF96|nr:hypothetical protein [Ktedonobacter sp. SOSP1-85]GHO77280.1 hypothetical protein KSD_50510 [Ktedonobacter sp. SOSP1-85]